MLYEGPNLSGRTYVLDAEVLPNLDRAGFNDRASSLRIEGGYWLFCSDINFHGECLTFGPGDYPTLPRSLNNRISSGRRIGASVPLQPESELAALAWAAVDGRAHVRIASMPGRRTSLRIRL